MSGVRQVNQIAQGIVKSPGPSLNGAALRDAALWWLAEGCPVVPMTFRSKSGSQGVEKIPIVQYEHWKSGTPQTVEDVEAMPWDRAHGVAIILWPASKRIVIDEDGEGADRLLTDAGITLPRTGRMHTPSGGRHHHLLAPPGTPSLQPNATDQNKRQIRLLHAIDSEGKPCKPAIDLLFNGIVVVAGPGYREDPDYPLDTGQLSIIPQAVLDLAREKDRPRAEGGQRSSLWVTELMRGVPQGQRNDAASKLAGYFCEKKHPEDVTREILRSFGERCTPHIEPRELERIVQSIYRTDQRRGGQAPQVGSVSSPVVWVIQDAADYQTWKVEPVRWAVEPIISKNSIGYLGGLPKIGKTLLMFDLLLHIIHRRPWLARFKGDWIPRTLYLAREDPTGRLQGRIDEIQEGYGFPPIPKGLFHLLIRERFQLTDTNHIAWLTTYCKDEGIELVILDVLGRMIRGKDQMDPGDWSEIQDILEALNREHGLTVIVLDHARKPLDAKKKGSLSAMEIKGPIEKYGGADWSMVIGRTKEKSRLEIITEGKDTDERLHFLVDVSPMARRNGTDWEVRQPDGVWISGHPKPKLTYAGDVVELAESRKEVGQKNREAVYAAIPGGQRVQIGAVLERLGKARYPLGRSAVKEHLKDLLEERRLDSTGKGRNVWYWCVEGEGN